MHRPVYSWLQELQVIGRAKHMPSHIVPKELHQPALLVVDVHWPHH